MRDKHSLHGTVSVIVPCYNEVRNIGSFLDSFLQQDLDGIDCEIIVADGISQDGTRQVLNQYREKLPKLVIIDNPNRIVSTGLNAAIREARGDVIVRMDVHTEYATDYIRRCVIELEKTSVDNVGGPARTRTDGYLAQVISAAYHCPFSCGGARFHNVSHEGYVDTVPYGCWRKTTLERLGFFDESLVRNQDDELNLRIIRSGGKIWQSPHIVSWYHPRASLSGLFLQYFQYGFWKVALIWKHGTPASWRHLVPAAFVLSNLMFFWASVLGTSRSIESGAVSGWAILVTFYAASCSVASYVAGRRHGWKICSFLPIVFAVYHLSYGIGSLFGMFYWPIAKSSTSHRLSRLFTGISR